MFKITEGKGFHLTFANGIVLSVQFGRGNYCENRGISSEKERKMYFSSKDAEIAIWDGESKYLTNEANKDIYGEELHDDVKGWVSVTDVVKFVNWCENYKEVSK